MGIPASVTFPKVSNNYTEEELDHIIHSERQLRDAQKMAEVGSWEWDILANRITWSDELYRHFGLNPEEFEATYEAFIERIHPDDRDLVNSTVEKAMAEKLPWSFEHRIVRPDGEVRWVFGQGAVDAKDGQPIRMYGTEQDITARMQLEEQQRTISQLEEINDFRMTLLNTVAHELNTPLTPLLLQAHVLSSSAADMDDRQQRSLDILNRNLRRLKLLVSDILDMSKMQSNRLQLRDESTDAADILDDARETFSEAANEAGVELEVDAESIPLRADPDRLTQVLYNLTGNAIKFTPKGGRVVLRARQEEDHILMEVEDTGAGITKVEAAKLFQPFEQVHDRSSEPGTGLGLFISKGITEAHGGTLTMRSPGKDKGATFSVQIPCSVTN